MEYFKINNIDFSHCVSELKINTSNSYNAQTNAAGNTVVDYINSKRVIEVGIIPLNPGDMMRIQNELKKFNVTVSFMNTTSSSLEEINCIIPNNNIEYYTIRVDKMLYKAFSLSFIEL